MTHPFPYVGLGEWQLRLWENAIRPAKPRLYHRDGFWFCHRMGSQYGAGKTTREAFTCWLERNRAGLA